jgi:hypothetical protein
VECGGQNGLLCEYSVKVGTYLLYWWVCGQEGGSVVLCACCEGRDLTAFFKCCVGGFDGDNIIL